MQKPGTAVHHPAEQQLRKPAGLKRRPGKPRRMKPDHEGPGRGWDFQSVLRNLGDPGGF